MKLINDYGNFFRGLSEYNKDRPLHVKIMAVFFSFFLLILPGAALIILVIFNIYSLIQGSKIIENIFTLIPVTLFGLIFFIGGIKSLINNIK